MKNIFVTKLRNKYTKRHEFREAALALSHLLAQEVISHLETKKEPVLTPITTTEGAVLKDRVILAPILRSGITMVSPFLTYFHAAPIAVIGITRDEETAKPLHYYTKIPPLEKNDTILILDPILATGGTSKTAIQLFIDRGIPEKNIIFVGIVCAPEGIENVKGHFPGVTLIIAAHDDHLNEQKFIVPGIGDFGDRYFGTE